jgi:hypothetical protein
MESTKVATERNSPAQVAMPLMKSHDSLQDASQASPQPQTKFHIHTSRAITKAGVCNFAGSFMAPYQLRTSLGSLKTRDRSE